jgi:hypothetical protein
MSSYLSLGMDEGKPGESDIGVARLAEWSWRQREREGLEDFSAFVTCKDCLV